jgi:hypothetical protein
MFKRPKQIHKSVYIIYIIILVGLFGCNFPTRAKATEPSAGYIYTAAAETVQAQLTQVSQPPATSGITTDTMQVIGTPSPTSPAGTITQKPDSTSTEETRCDLAEFVKDVTFPDDTKLLPGEEFDKTWRLKNVGTCTWSPAYAVVFIGDNDLNSPASVQLSISPIAPGETVDISVPLQAPLSNGKFRQNFKLANETGEQFGVGSNGTKPFWAQIVVGEESGIAFDFLTRAPDAEWKSGIGDSFAKELTFGGDEDDPDGAVKILDAVTLENGSISGKLLLSYPKRVNDGVIAGIFPEYKINEGDRLKARIGFLAGSNGECGEGRVIFRIAYQEGESAYLLGEWRKACDGSLMPVNINLSGLEGKTVKIIFLVDSDGLYEDDWAIWNSPRIER